MLYRGRTIDFDVHHDEDRNQLIDALTERLYAHRLSAVDAGTAAALVVDLLMDELRDAVYFREISAELQRAMGDPDAWDDDGAPATALIRYIRHLASAVHGTCTRCGRVVRAGDLFEAVPLEGLEEVRLLLCSDCA